MRLRVPSISWPARRLPEGRVLGRPLPVERVGRRGAGLLAVVVVSSLSVALFLPAANADDLTDKRDQLKSEISQTKDDLSESSSALNAATAAVSQAQGRLAAAQAALQQTRAALAAAKTKDAEAAARLKQAQVDLAKAKAAVVAGQARLDAAKKLAGEMVRDQYQQQTSLLPLAMLTDTTSTSDLATRVQWATTMFDTTGAKIDDLVAAQQVLDAEKARQAKLEAQVASDRAEAAATLVAKKRLEAQAADAAASVATLVVQRQTAESAAADDVAADKAQYAQLVKERSSVEQRIAQRIAAQKAAEARRVAAEKAAEARRVAAEKAAAAKRAAAERAAAKAAAAARQAAKEKAAARTAAARAKAAAREKAAKRAEARASASARAHQSSKASSSSRSSGSSSSSSAHHGFIYPVSAPITSPYGMRFHPVLHVWKLHDGTDFGAGCGTPIKAAYDGTVEEKYFNAGYGNRLIVDHGKVDGTYVTTAYNHAIRYVVHVGQHVSQGQTLGYVGETGYATGCHLHLMVYLNGTMVNPMSWY